MALFRSPLEIALVQVDDEGKCIARASVVDTCPDDRVAGALVDGSHKADLFCTYQMLVIIRVSANSGSAYQCAPRNRFG
jgi:hypothetical protein